MNIKQGLLATILIGTILMTSFYSLVMATPALNDDYHPIMQEGMHEHMKARLNKLEKRLEIKSSQQGDWEKFSKSVEVLAEQNVAKPDDNADAATISRYSADRASELARKLTGIADATAQLQTALTNDQRKILNQVARHFINHNRGWIKMSHGGIHDNIESVQSGNADNMVSDIGKN